MAKFTKSQLKKSLLSGLSLMVKEDKYEWALFEEIPSYYESGYVLFNYGKHKIWSNKYNRKLTKKRK
jgi:hypothetical protein